MTFFPTSFSVSPVSEGVEVYNDHNTCLLLSVASLTDFETVLALLSHR